MQEIDQPKSSGPEIHASKKRRMDERVVVAVKIEENDKRQQRNEGPPSDCWSWRKYGQKPIKGSPYPRGYYRCSTSKGCSAKKQVERSKTDSSMLIITYTSNHNHPGPDFSPPNNQKTEQNEMKSAPQINDHTETTTSKQEQETELILPPRIANSEDHFQYSQSLFHSTPDRVIIVDQEDNNTIQENLQTPSVVYNEDSKQRSQDAIGFSSLLKSEENDFFDELEELPTSSFFTSFIKDRVIVDPS